MKKEEFEETFRTYYTSLVSYVRRIVSDEDECHDIVEMAFESIWVKLDNIDYRTVQKYLYSTVYHIAINNLRRRKSHNQYVDYFKTTNTEFSDMDDIKAYEERLRIARKVVATIGEPTRSILVKCYIDGKKYRDVAEEFGVSVSTIKKHMVKALKILADFRKNMPKE